jgi:hypothetical protein
MELGVGRIGPTVLSGVPLRNMKALGINNSKLKNVLHNPHRFSLHAQERAPDASNAVHHEMAQELREAELQREINHLRSIQKMQARYAKKHSAKKPSGKKNGGTRKKKHGG